MGENDHGRDSGNRPGGKNAFAEALQKIIERLDQPLLLFILAAAIVLAAAAPLAGQNLVTLSLAVILLITTGLVTWVFLEIRKNPDAHLRASYGIKIDEPRGGEFRTEKVLVKGTYKKKPPIDNLLRLFTISTDGRCWPQSIANVGEDGKWECTLYLGGQKPDYEIKVAVAIVGRSTQILWDYDREVLKVMKAVAPNAKRPVIQGWPPDAIIQDTIFVKRIFDWDEKSVFEDMKRRVGAGELEVARLFFDWMKKDGRDVIYGDGRESGSAFPRLRARGIKINPVYLSSDGKIWFQFASLEGKPVFGDLDKRRELMKRFAVIKGADLADADLARGSPSISLSKIAADPDGPAKLLSALDWMVEQIAERTPPVR